MAPNSEVAPNHSPDNIITLNNQAKQEARKTGTSTGTSTGEEKKKKNPNEFTHHGRTYLLYKRQEDRMAPYYCRIQFEGKRHQYGTGTNHQAQAEERAKLWIDRVQGGRWEHVEKMKAKKSTALFGQVSELYRPADGTMGLAGIKDASARNNVWAFGKVFKVGLNIDDPAKVRLEVVNEALVSKFQRNMEIQYCADAGKSPQVQAIAREQSLRSSRSLIRQARSLFNQSVMKQYREQGLKIPACVDGFMKAKLRGEDKKREYLQPPDEVVQGAMVNIEKMREPDPEVYRAFWLALGCGLRRGEIFRARWEHFAVRNGQLYYDGDLSELPEEKNIGKDGEPVRVPVQAKGWAKLLPFKQAKGRVLGENATMEFARRINWWMKGQGWNTEKKLHELRAYIGSLLYREDPKMACLFMRHKDVETTKEFYVRYGAEGKVTDVL
jgi:integrase